MEETGNVTAVEGAMAHVRLLRSATCDRCGACGMGKRPEITVAVPNTAGARPGDVVRLAVEDRSVLRAAAAAYAVPLLALIAGYAIVSAVLGWLGVGRFREGLAIAAGFLSLLPAYRWIRTYDRRFGGRVTPRMVEVVRGTGREAETPDPPGC
ncbi:MAG: SoxR reducing system RseC family protein [Patescibacteria group bacterium]